jgi:hypothetical protein
MQFRIGHILVAMVFVGLWLQLAQWLLALAQDHPLKPQSTADFIGFYVDSLPIAFLPWMIAWVVVAIRKRPTGRSHSNTSEAECPGS